MNVLGGGGLDNHPAARFSCWDLLLIIIFKAASKIRKKSATLPMHYTTALVVDGGGSFTTIDAPVMDMMYCTSSKIGMRNLIFIYIYIYY